MSNFDRESLANLEKLCHIQCTPDEEKELLEALQRILTFVEQLDDIDTQNTPPCDYVLKDIINDEMRNDEINDLLPRDKFLANAFDQIEGMIRVPPVMKDI